jgi:hypothetical protein
MAGILSGTNKLLFSIALFALVFICGCDRLNPDFGGFVDEQLKHFREGADGVETGVDSGSGSDTGFDTDSKAALNGQPYPTLSAAVTAATTGSGNVITVLQDITIDASEADEIKTGMHGKTITLTVPANATKTIKRGGGYTASLFTVVSGSLTLEGSGTGGLILDGGAAWEGGSTAADNSGLSAAAPLITVNTDGVFNMENGATLTNNDQINSPNAQAETDDGYGGGAVFVHGGIFNMTGGTISNCKCPNGGGVFVTQNGSTDPGAFNLSGGTITGNYGTSNGGGILIRYGEASISGNAIIEHNKGGSWGAGGAAAVNGAISISGNAAIRDNIAGGLSIETSSGSITMTGGTVSNNTTTAVGAGVYVKDGTFTMSANALIMNDNDVYLAAGRTITIDGNLTASPAAKITPSAYTTKRILTGTPALTSGNYGKFTLSNTQGGGWYIDSDGYLIQTSNIITLKKNDGTITSYATLSAAIEASTTATLANPDVITIRQDITTNVDGTNSAFSINGKHIKLVVSDGKTATIQRTASGLGSLFTVGVSGTGSYASLTLEGSGTGQLIIDGGKDNNLNATAALIMVESSGTLNLYDGGIIKNNLNNLQGSQYGGGIKNNGTFNMYGGEISGNSVTTTSGSRGGGVLNNKTFNMSGGRISGNIAESGGGVSNEPYNTQAEFTMSGGTISGNTATNSGGGVYVFMNSPSSTSGSSTFTMSGGNIFGNNIVPGSGASVYVGTDAIAKYSNGDSISTTEDTLTGH